MSKTVIMVCAHKRDACLAEPPYLPVQVGRAIAREDLGYTGDDSGENISAKNRNYCELTAQYWAWKNRSDADYIGLCHYRRYFDFGSRSLANVKTRTPAEFFASAHPVPDMDRVFRRYDVVLGRPKYYPYNLYTDYSRQHIREDLDLLRTVLGEKYLDYLPAFDRFFFRGNRLSHFNMFVMPRERFDAYSAWLFDLLEEVERRIRISDDPVQARVMGYMSERLLNVYVQHNRLRICYRPVVMVDERKRKGTLKFLFHAGVNNLLFFVTYPFRKHAPSGDEG